MKIQTVNKNKSSDLEFSPTAIYCVTYRQKFGRCFIYRNEMMMGISVDAVRTLAELLLEPDTTISYIQDIYPLMTVSPEISK